MPAHPKPHLPSSEKCLLHPVFLLAVPHHLPHGDWWQEPHLTEQDHFPGPFNFDLRWRKKIFLPSSCKAMDVSLELRHPFLSFDWSTHVLMMRTYCVPVSVLGTGAAVVNERDEVPVRMKERSIVIPEGNSGNLFRLPSLLCRSPGAQIGSD